MPEPLPFGAWLKRLRVDLDLTQEALAESVGCAAQTIRTYERGTRRPSREVAARLAAVLQVPSEQRVDFMRVARAPAGPAPAPRTTTNQAVAGPDAYVERKAGPATDTGAQPDGGQSALRSDPASAHGPMLSTKLYVPRVRAHLVPRPRLLARLDAGLAGPLTLIAASAGFGKTTLLAEWLNARKDRHLHIAWLSLDAGDSDPIQFLRYLLAALQTIARNVGTAVVNLLRSAQAPPIELVVPLLLNDLVQLPENSILVLDDYHIIDAPAVHQILTFLLDHLPPQLHLVLASRIDPPLPLSRLRARGQLTELRAADLRFTPDEAATFLQEVMDLPLSTEDVAALEARTEGWIAGLQLAALAMRDRTDFGTFIQAFTGSNRFVVDYLVPEVVERLPAHLQTFVLQTAILDRMCAPLCDAVVLGDDAPPAQAAYSQLLLEELERMNLFLVPLDDQRRWYRYHHLFAEVVRVRLLHGVAAETVAALHRRAGAWFESQNLVVEAVLHALAAGDVDHAVRVIEQRGLLLMLQGQLQQVTTWLDALPDTHIRQRPVLSIIRAVSLMLSNRLASVEPYLQDAERWIRPDTPDDQARTIRGAAAVIRANVSYLVGDLPRVIVLIHQALGVLPETETSALPGMLVTIFRSAAQSFTALAYKVTGDVTAASERLAADVIGPVRAAGNLFATLYSMTYLALLQVYQGRLRAAADTYDQAAQLTPEAGGLQILVASPTYYIGLGDLLRERNELDRAAQYLRQGIDIVRGTMTIDANAATHGYVAWAYLQQARGDSLGARATLEEFAHLAEQRGFFHVLVARGAAARAQLLLAQGDIAAATRWAETSGLDVDDERSFFREAEYLALARVRIAQGRTNPASSAICEALRLLDRALQTAEAGARNGSVIEILILRALALHAHGDLSQALATLERALTLAAPEGYVRVFVDEGAPMAALLAQALKETGWGLDAKSQEHNERGYAHTLLAVLGAEGITAPIATPLPTAPAHSPIPGVEALTERELEVLRLLVAGHSNHVIAQRLIVAVGTVKRHVNSILGKLGVQSRLQAVARARELDLL